MRWAALLAGSRRRLPVHHPTPTTSTPLWRRCSSPTRAALLSTIRSSELSHMAGFVGIDIGKTHVRAAGIGVGYKRLSLGRMEEVALDSVESLERAVQIVAAPLLEHADAIAVAVDGDHCFTHRIAIPATAAKRLEEVLPFEIEAQVPIDIDELVFDYRALRRRDSKEPVVVMTAAARIDAVRARIDLIQSALSRQPDRVGCGPIALANLAAIVSPLRGPGPFALVDLGAERTEVTVLQNGEAVFV